MESQAQNMSETVHPSSDDLERFILKSPGLAADDLKIISRHLATCTVCAERTREFAAFYDQQEQDDPSIFSVPATSFFARLSNEITYAASNVIDLFPANHPTGSIGGRSGAVALAAKDMVQVKRPAAVCTFVSSNERTVLRVVRDTKARVCIAQVLSDEPGASAHALVTFSSSAESYLTDAAGEFQIGGSLFASLGGAPATVRAVVERFPIEKRHYDDLASGIETRVLGDRGGTLHVHPGESSLLFTFTLADVSTRTIAHVVVKAGMQVSIFVASDNSITLPRHRFEEADLVIVF
jgi:hypothetical protein